MVPKAGPVGQRAGSKLDDQVVKHGTSLCNVWDRVPTLIYKVPINRTARLVNKYRHVGVFATLKDAREAALAFIERVEANSRSKFSLFWTEPSPESEALRRRLWELTEDRVETFNP